MLNASFEVSPAYVPLFFVSTGEILTSVNGQLADFPPLEKNWWAVWQRAGVGELRNGQKETPRDRVSEREKATERWKDAAAAERTGVARASGVVLARAVLSGGGTRVSARNPARSVSRTGANWSRRLHRHLKIINARYGEIQIRPPPCATTGCVRTPSAAVCGILDGSMLEVRLVRDHCLKQQIECLVLFSQDFSSLINI